MVTYIDLSDKSLDYLTAISDIRKSIAFRRGRGWSWDQIIQMLEGLGHLADQNINVLLIDMACKEDGVIPSGYTRCSDGTLVESPPMLGTEADHPDHPDHPDYCKHCRGRCSVTH